MAFDQNTRGRLQKLVNACRALLSDDFSIQLQQVYGLDPKTGEVTPMERLTHLDDRQRHTAQVLRQVLGHYLGADADDTEHRIAVIDRMVREQAFTVLNRMAALLMMEARGQLFESVSKAYQSRGFQSYARLAGTALGETGQAYQAYLFSLFDELAHELQGLFDRFAANGLLFPRETALRALLDELNHPDITPLWAEDETIGWIYQYFNSKEERKAMREASQVPRNSRELAVRNQFFTPRYVVEFLVDNTLGRLWYQATKGTTALKERCQYLLCTPRDVFLRRFDADDSRPGSVAALVQAGKWSELPAFDTSEVGVQAMIDFAHCVNTYDRHPNNTWGDYFLRIEAALRAQRLEDLSTQELWDGVFLVCRADRHGGDGSVYQERWFVAACQAIVDRLTTDEAQQKANVIAHHTVRDPRTLKLLDPACGSMHFGLYAFDLFAEIYREAWAWEQQNGPGSLDVSTQPKVSLQPLSQTYTDEAAFLRDVPRLIIEHNIYGVDIDPRAAQIASLALWLRAQRAWHDAGVKAKDRPLIGHGHVVAAIAPPAERELRQQFVANLDPRDAELFDKTLQLLRGLPELGVLLQVERDLPSLIRQVYVGKGTGLFAQEERADWQAAEARLCTALTDFAQAAKSTYQRRLFAQDALQGLRLIDLCREGFDVIVMNPPFGAPSKSSKAYVDKRFSRSKNDLLCVFIDRAVELLVNGGYLGCITSRTVLFLTSFAEWREATLLQSAPPEIVADLGHGVLDAAMVETAAYCMRKGAEAGAKVPFLRLGQLSNREQSLKTLIDVAEVSSPNENIFIIPVSSFRKIPGAPFSYWISEEIRDLFSRFKRFETDDVVVRVTNPTADNFRYLRNYWECISGSIGENGDWVPYAKGGSSKRYYYDVNLLAMWDPRVPTYKGYQGTVHRSDIRPASLDYFFKPGIMWPLRAPRMCAQGFPKGTAFSARSQCLFAEERNLPYFLGLMNSSTLDYLFKAALGRTDFPEFIVGVLRNLPKPIPSVEVREEISNLALQAAEISRKCAAFDEIDHMFVGPRLVLFREARTLAEAAQHCLSTEDKWLDQIDAYQVRLDDLVVKAYGLSRSAASEVENASTRPGAPEEAEHAVEEQKNIDSDDDSVGMTESRDLLSLGAQLFSWLVGCAFGRWNTNISISDMDAQTGVDLLGHQPLDSLALVRSSRDIRDNRTNEILVDDPGNSLDLVRFVISSIEKIWVENRGAIEDELCALLQFKDLRSYLCKVNGFFESHFQQYSKSGRKSPIYWPISTSKMSYTLWIYYPRLTSQTLYTAINDFVDPKLKQIGEEVIALRIKGAARTRDDEKQFETLQAFELELIELRDALLKLAPTYKPNHADGVQISAAPLWPLFRHKPWQKVLKDTWIKLEKGDYDWAHLAMNYWPERVREKCKTDKSLAIAHGLEDMYVEPEAAPKKTRGRKKKEDDE